MTYKLSPNGKENEKRNSIPQFWFIFQMSGIQIIRLQRQPVKFSIQRCKDLLKFARGVMRASSSGNSAHDDDQLYLCERKSCECAEHAGVTCTNNRCQCAKHFSVFLCDENKCSSSVRFDRYIGCKATGCIINTDLHVCHRACPHLLNDKNRGFVCQISGNYFEESQLYCPPYTFKIDSDLVDNQFNEISADDNVGVPNEDEIEEEDGARVNPTHDFTETEPSESKRGNKKARRTPRRLTSDWHGKNVSAQSDFDCIRVAMLSAAKTVASRVLVKPQVLSDAKFTQLITTACHYYVQYRINDSPTPYRSTPRLLLDQTDPTYRSPQDKDLRAPYRGAFSETEESPDRADSGYRYRRSVVSGHRKPRRVSSGNPTARDGTLDTAGDDGDPDRGTASSRRNNKNTNMRMFYYFILGFIQGCLTEDPNFPRMSLNRADFVDLKQWHLYSNIINRNVTRFTTAIASAVETGRISEWNPSDNRSLYLPPEVLQWNDWRV